VNQEVMVLPANYRNGKLTDRQLIEELFPKSCPKVEPPPSLDQIVCDYLYQHDVKITPVSSDVQPSRLTNAAMGAFGAEYAAASEEQETKEED
jgi:hypothetical protein